MRNRLVSTSIVLVAAACAAGCGMRRDDGYSRRGYETPRVDEITLTQRRQFQDDVQRRLDEVGAKIDELRARAHEATAEERERLNRLGDELAVQRDIAAAKLRELREVASEKWDEFRDGLESSVKSVEDRISETFRK